MCNHLANFCSFRYTLCDFVATTITEMGHTQPSWQIDSSADITGNKVKAVDTGTDCSNDYVEIRKYIFLLKSISKTILTF